MDDNILKYVKEYITWDSYFNWAGWKSIEIYTGQTLSEAWIKARPDDEYKFEDMRFKEAVDSANGKWLEKQFPEDKYKVLLSLSTSDDPIGLACVLAHELRHCLDYINAVAGIPFEKYTPGNQFYYDWSEFRAAMVSFEFQFFHKNKENLSNRAACFEGLSSLLGIWIADSIEGIFNANSKRDILYFLSRYIGAARAARNLSDEYVPAVAYQLWHLMPLKIYENYGYVFYVANDWEDIQICRLNQEDTVHYAVLLKRVEKNN